MIEDLVRRFGARPLVASTAMIASAACAIGCGDASGDAARTSTAPAAKARVAATTTPTTATPAATTPTTATPATTTPDAPAEPSALDQAQAAKGTVSLRTLRFGYGGKLVVTPNGDVPGPATVHWYKPGTHVAIRAEDTRFAQFREWGLTCHGKQRVCEVVVPRRGGSVVAGFDTADGIKKTDPRVEFILND